MPTLATDDAFGFEQSPSPADAPQAADDPSLLELMVAEAGMAPARYQATNYWKPYQDRLLPELRRIGLRDFRRRRASVIGAFTPVEAIEPLIDLSLRRVRFLNNRFSARIPGWSTFLDTASRWLERVLPMRPGYDLSHAALCELCFEYCRAYGERTGAKPLTDFEDSLVGNPEDVFRFGGKWYGLRYLSHYLRYAYCCQFIDFDQIDTIAELGCGSGHQAAVLKKLHPHLTILQFDLVPQIYVCEQHLKSVFPGDVISFRDNLDLDPAAGLERGKVYILGNWQFPMMRNLACDLFVNCASFQEMEPSVVADYLDCVNDSCGNAYLSGLFSGMSVAREAGRPGVLQETPFSIYERGLSRFERVDRSPLVTHMGQQSSSENTFWCRRPAPR